MSAALTPWQLTRRQAAWLLVLSYALFFAPALFDFTAAPYYRDHTVTNLPQRVFIHDTLMKGELPLWFPHEGLGVPVVGQIATATFHPLNVLLFWLPPIQGEKVVLLLAYLAGLLGAYRCARALGAPRAAGVLTAWSFALGGYALGVSSIIAYALSVNALPWVLVSAFRLSQRQRWVDSALLALSSACVFLSGDALGFAACGALCAMVFADRPQRRTAGLMLLGGVWASALIAMELLPASILARDSLRQLGTAPASLGFTWATHPTRFLEFVVPAFIPDAQRALTLKTLMGGGSAVFCTTIFMGTLTLAAAVQGLASSRRRSTWLAAALAVVSVLLACGGHLGLLGVVQQVLPLLSKFRYPERYLAFVWVALVLVVPHGFTAMLHSKARLARLTLVFAGVIALGLCVPGAAQALAALNHAVITDELSAALSSQWLRSAGLSVLVCLAALVVLWRVSAGLPSRFVLLAALCFADLLRGNAEHLPVVDTQVFEPAPLAQAVLAMPRDVGAPVPRVLNQAATEWPSGVTLPGRDRWVRGMLSTFKASATALNGVPSITSNLGLTQARHAMTFGVRDELALPLAPFFNTCALVTEAANAQLGDVVDQDMALAIHPVACWPRVLLVGAEPCTPPQASAFMKNQLKLEVPRICWEGPARDVPTGATAKYRQFSNSHFEVEVSSATSAALFISNDFIGGWHATIDGLATEIHPALLTGQGIDVPAGQHRVDLSYWPPGFSIGLWVSITAWLLMLGVLGARLRRVTSAPSAATRA